jgi:lysozyme
MKPIITDIIDVARHELKGADIPAAAKAGLLALWAKSSQGKDWLDPTFAVWEKLARDSKLLFGAYHFASGSGDGRVQADFFLAHVNPLTMLLALDWENNPDTKNGNMSLANAEAFVSRVRELTGRWPVLYSGASFLREHRIPTSSVLGHCPLWLAQYGEEPHVVPSPWLQWDLWQYSDYAFGPRDTDRFPRQTPGLGRKVDRSAFYGDADALREWWRNCGRDVGPARREVG